MHLITYIRSKDIIKRILEGTFWSFLGMAIARVFSLVTNICIARFIGREDFGAYGVINSTLEMFSFLGGLSMGVTMIKYTAEYRKKDPVRAGRILTLTRSISYLSAGCVSASLFLSSDWIANTILNRSDLGHLLKIGSVYMCIRTVNNIQLGGLAGFEAFKETAKVNSITGLLTPIITIPMVYLFDLEGAVIALALPAVLGYCMCRHYFRKECMRHGIVLNMTDLSVFHEWPILLKFSLPAFMSFLLLIPVTWFTNAMLVNQPDGYGEMGLFNAANQWRQFVVFIPTIMTAVMMSIFSDTYASGRSQQYKEAYTVNMKMTWMTALPATILVITFGNELNNLFGDKFTNAMSIIPPLMITAFITIINTVTSTAIMSAGRMWTETMFNLCWAVVLIAASAWLIPLHGAKGLAFANLLAYIMQVLARMIYIENKLIDNSISEFWMFIAITLITVFSVLLLSWSENLTILWGLLLAAIGSTPLIIQVKELIIRTHS